LKEARGGAKFAAAAHRLPHVVIFTVYRNVDPPLTPSRIRASFRTLETAL